MNFTYLIPIITLITFNGLEEKKEDITNNISKKLEIYTNEYKPSKKNLTQEKFKHFLKEGNINITEDNAIEMDEQSYNKLNESLDYLGKRNLLLVKKETLL